MERWSIYIDVEGYSAIYREDKNRALRALRDLMEALFGVGTRVFSSSPDRLFIHQFGDGFCVVSDFPENSPERPIAICLAIMRHLIARGVATKAAVSGGDFSDVFGCYPQSVQEVAKDHRYVNLGDGLMTITPVMGLALISPYRMAAQRSGAILLLDTLLFAGIPHGVKVISTGPTIINWINSDLPMVQTICDAAELTFCDARTTRGHLLNYLKENPSLSKSWISSTLESLGMSDGSF